MRWESAQSTIKIYIIWEKGDGGSDIRAVPDSSSFHRNRRNMLPLSPCHTNDVLSTSFPRHIKVNKSGRFFFLFFLPLSDIQKQEQFLNLSLFLNSHLWWDKATENCKWYTNRPEFMNHVSLAYWQCARIYLCLVTIIKTSIHIHLFQEDKFYCKHIHNSHQTSSTPISSPQFFKARKSLCNDFHLFVTFIKRETHKYTLLAFAMIQHKYKI